MKKLFAVLIALAIISAINLSNAQRVGVSLNIGGGGYYGGGRYGGYNHYGYAAAPYVGVATGPIGYGGPHRGHCNWDRRWHRWGC